tara:strand:- start:269 stop:919 length:651 start_codon:yes stop_codon:yes gene_type:complete
MRRSFKFFVFLFFISSHSFSQYGSIELNTGGFSFIPIFTSDKPHMIIRAGTNQDKRFTLNLLNLVMLDGLTPTNYSLMARYMVFHKKFKLSLGTHFPGYRVMENEEYRSRYVHEIRSSYPINPKTKLLFLYMHGIGRNFEMTNNFYSIYFQKIFKKIISTTQFYQLYTNLLDEPSTGIAQKFSLELSKKMKLNVFVNKSIIGKDIFNRTLGIEYSF